MVPQHHMADSIENNEAILAKPGVIACQDPQRQRHMYCHIAAIIALHTLQLCDQRLTASGHGDGQFHFRIRQHFGCTDLSAHSQPGRKASGSVSAEFASGHFHPPAIGTGLVTNDKAQLFSTYIFIRQYSLADLRILLFRHRIQDKDRCISAWICFNVMQFHINQPFGRVASAQIGMKECRQTAAFLVE